MGMKKFDELLHLLATDREGYYRAITALRRDAPADFDEFISNLRNDLHAELEIIEGPSARWRRHSSLSALSLGLIKSELAALDKKKASG